MHHIFKRVVVLINDSQNMDNLLQKGIEFSKQYKTTLEALFVKEHSNKSLFDYFLSSPSTKSSSLDTEKIKEKIQEHINNLDNSIGSAVFIVEEDVVDRVLAHGKDSQDTLFVTNYCKKHSKELLEKTPYSYWIFKANYSSHKNILLPIELSECAKEDIGLTQTIFPKSSVSIVHDYRYMIPRVEEDGSATIVPVVGHIDKELHQRTREKHKSIFDDYKKKFSVEGDFLEEKEGLEEDIVNYIKNRDTDLIVIHHHEKLIFVPSLTFDLLDDIECDFFVLNR